MLIVNSDVMSLEFTIFESNILFQLPPFLQITGRYIEPYFLLSMPLVKNSFFNSDKDVNVSSQIFEYKAILKKICIGNQKSDLSDKMTH